MTNEDKDDLMNAVSKLTEAEVNLSAARYKIPLVNKEVDLLATEGEELQAKLKMFRIKLEILAR